MSKYMRVLRERRNFDLREVVMSCVLPRCQARGVCDLSQVCRAQACLSTVDAVDWGVSQQLNRNCALQDARCDNQQERDNLSPEVRIVAIVDIAL